MAPFHPLYRAMKKENCDIWIFPSQDAYAYWLPVKSIGVIHDLMHRYERRFPEVGNAKEYAAREFHYTMMCRFSEGIFVDSHLGKKHVIESYGLLANKCHVLPYIAPPVQNETTLELDKNYDLPPKFFFYPAQFWQHKNHENLLKALRNCVNSHPDMKLVLVGCPKNYYEAILALIKKLNLVEHVKILGLVPDEAVPLFYKNARALIMPTFFGPTNIPPLEAFAFHCPVAISGVYGMPEQLQDAALYFDPNSVKDIQDCMLKLWEDDALCHTLIEKGNAHHNGWKFQHFSKKLESIVNAVN
jgi:glycosyltransferase involved in cell wall biosynthesis